MTEGQYEVFWDPGQELWVARHTAHLEEYYDPDTPDRALQGLRVLLQTDGGVRNGRVD